MSNIIGTVSIPHRVAGPITGGGVSKSVYPHPEENRNIALLGSLRDHRWVEGGMTLADEMDERMWSPVRMESLVARGLDALYMLVGEGGEEWDGLVIG
jgi:hypothetical protein